ncbi:hypothetical protein Dimus_012755 [Dionaea muscipula]
MFSGEIDALNDDGFEGSNDELCISQEVFHGSDSTDIGKSSAATGVVNVKSRQSNLVEVLHCPGSEKLSLNGQVYSRNLCGKDDDSATGMSKRNFLTVNSNKEFALVGRDDDTVTTKCMKLPVGQLPDSKPYLEDMLASSMPLKDIGSGVQQPTPPVFPVLTCHVVESSGHGLITSCYVLNKSVEFDNDGYLDSSDVPEVNLSGSGRCKGNIIGIPESIASPDSQESFATKSLAAGSSAPIVNEPGCLLSSGRRRKRAPSIAFEDDILFRGNGSEDPRLLLRHRTFCLLREAGWSIERRKRNCRAYPEFVYISPEGRPFREFPKAWAFCGERLLGDGINLLLAEEDKEWNSISQFWSDLFDALRTIDGEMKDREPKTALAHKWTLLDPFAIVVFIDRKILALKSGNVVKAKHSVPSGGSKSPAVSALKARENKNDSGCDRLTMTASCDSSLPSGNTILDFDRQSQGGAVQIPMSQSIYVSEGNSMTLLETKNERGSRNGEAFSSETRNQSLSASPSCVSDTTCLLLTGCLYDVPVEIGNLDMTDRQSVTFSSHQGSCCMSSLSCSKSNLEPIVEMAKEMGEEGAEPLERSIINGEIQVTGSVDDYPTSTDVELHKSYRLNRACKHSSSRLDIGSSSRKHSLFENLQCMEKKSGDLASVVHEKLQMSYDVHLKFVEATTNGIQGLKSQNLKKHDKYSTTYFDSKRKVLESQSRISEIDWTTSCAEERSILSASYRAEVNMEERNDQRIHMKSSDVEDRLGVHAQISENCNELCDSSSQRQSGKKPRYRKFDNDGSNCSKEVNLGKATDEAPIVTSNKKKSSKSCQLKDDDLLISAIIQNKIFRSSGTCCGPKVSNSKAAKRGTSQKGPCRLLPRGLGKGGKLITDGRWSSLGKRTVLCWLINMDVIFLNEVIQYRDSKSGDVVKDGFITRDGILCRCCNELLSLSQFKEHGGFELNRCCPNLFMESGKSFTLCQLQAWSTEYKTRKSGTRTVQVNEFDENDDSCGLCGDGGELLCCDNCPSTFHQSCLSTEELPEGSWYCTNCSCRSCGKLVDEKEVSSSHTAFKCSQCEHKYHGACLRGKGLTRIGSFLWFCCGGCEEVYSGLQSQIGISNHLDNGYSWILLRCIHDDQRMLSAHWFALKAECNSKLAVALTIMEECFVSMVDPRTGINMIPQAVYNWG